MAEELMKSFVWIYSTYLREKIHIANIDIWNFLTSASKSCIRNLNWYYNLRNGLIQIIS